MNREVISLIRLVYLAYPPELKTIIEINPHHPTPLQAAKTKPNPVSASLPSFQFSLPRIGTNQSILVNYIPVSPFFRSSYPPRVPDAGVARGSSRLAVTFIRACDNRSCPQSREKVSEKKLAGL